MPWGGRTKRRAAAALMLLLLIPAALLPHGAATGGLFGPPAQGACTDTLESKVGGARLAPFSEDPAAGSWPTWLVQPGDIYVPPPPAALSAQAAQERAEVLLIASARADWQEERARAWDAGPASRAWEDVIVDLLPSHSAIDPSKSPPRLARDLALFHAAMHDALVVAWHAKHCYGRAAPYAADPGLVAVVPPRDTPSYPSEHAVAAGVASVLLPDLFPLAPRQSFEALAREALESRLWAGANYRSDVDAGYALGRQVALLARAERSDDGTSAQWDGTRPPATNCTWSPTPPAFRQDPVEPLAGSWRPWLMKRGDQFRPPPPPACDGEEYLRQSRAVHDKSLSLTEAERETAIWYDAGPGNVMPPGFEMDKALNLSLKHGLTTMQHARLQSHLMAALSDAGIAAWDAKFTYWSDRPVLTIQRLWDANWTPILTTPAFPGYVSGHATFAGAAEAVLLQVFPSEAAWLRNDAADNAASRFLGGVHIQADNDRGLEVGRKVGALAVERLAASS